MSAIHQTYEYVIVRFSPFSETEEFANIGIVLVSPELGYFGYKLQTRKYARVVRFFEPLPREIYSSAIHQLAAELKRARRVASSYAPNQSVLNFGDKRVASMLFLDLIRRREGTIQVSPVRVGLGSDPEAKLEELFKHYVDREFATPVYNERLLELEVRASLQSVDLSGLFTGRNVGDGTYQARFPFVRVESGQIVKIIKPLFLGQSRPEAIIDHGNKWAYTVGRLRKAGVLPEVVLFPVRQPTDGHRRMVAYGEAIELLKEARIETVPIGDTEEVVRYAQS